MMTNTLLAGALLALVSAALFAFVGFTLKHRRVGPEYGSALRFFALWWFALAGSTAINAALSVLAWAGNRDLDLFVASTYAGLLLICLALLGLLYYLVFLFSGKRVLVGLATFYVLYFILLVYYVRRSHPIGIDARGWNVRLLYGNEMQGPLFLVVLGLLVLPQFLGALALFSLYWRVPDREQKFRVAVVSWSIILWFGSALVGSLLRVTADPGWQLLSRFIGLGAAMAILIAYRPPPVLRQWLQEGSRTNGKKRDSSPRLEPAAAQRFARTLRFRRVSG